MIESLNEITITKIDSELLVPIGAGVFIRSKILDTHDVVMNVGAGIAVNKTIINTNSAETDCNCRN